MPIWLRKEFGLYNSTGIEHLAKNILLPSGTVPAFTSMGFWLEKQRRFTAVTMGRIVLRHLGTWWPCRGLRS